MKARKEITLAVVIGLIIGLIVVGGILRARTAIVRTVGRSPSPSPLASGQKIEDTALPLTLDTLDNQVVKENSITISGKTDSHAYIVILGEKSEYIITPSELGVFSQKVDLVSGANTIKIRAYLEDGTLNEKTLTTVYSTSEI